MRGGETMKTCSRAIWTIVLGVFFGTMASAQATLAARETPTAPIMQVKSKGANSAKETKKKGIKETKGNKDNKKGKKKTKVPSAPEPKPAGNGGEYYQEPSGRYL